MKKFKEASSSTIRNISLVILVILILFNAYQSKTNGNNIAARAAERDHQFEQLVIGQRELLNQCQVAPAK